MYIAGTIRTFSGTFCKTPERGDCKYSLPFSAQINIIFPPYHISHPAISSDSKTPENGANVLTRMSPSNLQISASFGVFPL